MKHGLFVMAPSKTSQSRLKYSSIMSKSRSYFEDAHNIIIKIGRDSTLSQYRLNTKSRTLCNATTDRSLYQRLQHQLLPLKQVATLHASMSNFMEGRRTKRCSMSYIGSIPTSRCQLPKIPTNFILSMSIVAPVLVPLPIQGHRYILLLFDILHQSM